MTNIYFIKDHKTCEKIDQVENQFDDVYLNQVLSEYIKNNFEILPIYTQNTEFEIANDINLKNGIFVTKNYFVYKKMENVNKGYLYNSYSNTCEYLGCIVMINDSKINGSKINESKINDSNINDSKINDSKINDSKINEINIDEPKIYDSVIDDSKIIHLKINEIKIYDSEIDESKIIHSNINESITELQKK